MRSLRAIDLAFITYEMPVSWLSDALLHYFSFVRAHHCILLTIHLTSALCTVGVLHDGVMSPATQRDTSFFLSYITTATCMQNKFCRGFAREQDVRYEMLVSLLCT